MNNQSNNEMQTYTMSKALSFYEHGYEVYIAHPLDEDADDKMHSEQEIIEGDGHLFIIKERTTR
tara:strand:+ start:138 stop:329 length:192 start_codon:yes stop_codon:yes gene_type:complete